MIPIIVVALVFILIIIRRIGKFRLQIWQIMLAGAVVVLATIQISPQNALKAINLDVMFFLFGMFIVGEALVESGYLSYLSYRLFRRAKSLDSLVLIILFGMGLTAAFLFSAEVSCPVHRSIANLANHVSMHFSPPSPGYPRTPAHCREAHLAQSWAGATAPTRTRSDTPYSWRSCPCTGSVLCPLIVA